VGYAVNQEVEDGSTPTCLLCYVTSSCSRNCVKSGKLCGAVGLKQLCGHIEFWWYTVVRSWPNGAGPSQKLH